MPTVTIVLDEYQYNELLYLAQVFKKKPEDILKTVISMTLPTLVGLVKYLERNIRETKAVTEVTVPASEKAVDKEVDLERKLIEYIKSRGGKVYYPELIANFDLDIIKKLLDERKIVYKDSYICLPSECPP